MAGLAVAIAGLAFPAGAATLYKSIGPNGTIMFSDVPPADGSAVVDQRSMPPGATDATPMEEVFALLEADAELARANTRLDLAEHALARARRGAWSPREGLRLEAARLSPVDHERIAFYQRDVQEARKALVRLLRQRQLAQR